MKTSEEIVEDAKKSNELKDYSLLEMHLYLCIDQILKMYSNKQINKDEANRRKMLAVKKYEDLQKQYDFETTMFKEHIDHIKNTEMQRTKLRKMLNEDIEITESRLAEMLNIAMEILSICFKGEF